jgi:hypothetical protein
MTNEPEQAPLVLSALREVVVRRSAMYCDSFERQFVCFDMSCRCCLVALSANRLYQSG